MHNAVFYLTQGPYFGNTYGQSACWLTFYWHLFSIWKLCKIQIGYGLKTRFALSFEQKGEYKNNTAKQKQLKCSNHISSPFWKRHSLQGQDCHWCGTFKYSVFNRPQSINQPWIFKTDETSCPYFISYPGRKMAEEQWIHWDRLKELVSRIKKERMLNTYTSRMTWSVRAWCMERFYKRFWFWGLQEAH